MIESKAWDWSKNTRVYWLVPTIESCYLAESWKSKGYNKFLDLGCGLGRHSIYFGKRGKGNPSLTVLELLAKALNVPLYTLVINDIDPNNLSQ